MLKRILWFVATNIAFMITISIVMFVINLFFPNALNASTLNSNTNISSIFIYSGIVGFTSAFLSLCFSKQIAKWTTKTQVIQENSINPMENFLFNTVKQQAGLLGLKMPEVGVYQDDTPNAFATGRSKNSSLVSFSSGLLNRMNQNEIEAVVAHELSHIKNGDMVTLTLIQGVVNTFVFAISRIITNVVRSSDNSYLNNPLTLFIVNIGLQIVLSILTTPIVAYFSRIREYNADAGAAKLIGKNKMIAALNKLELITSKESGLLESNSALSASGINENGEKNMVQELFATHPSIKNRITALNNL